LTLLVAGIVKEQQKQSDVSRASVAREPATPVVSVEQLLDELVDYHAAPPAPQITEASLVPDLEPEVGVPVHLPELAQYGARWEGGSVVPVRNQRAAVFRYRLSEHPVTIYVYNSGRVPLRGALEPRVVRDTAVHVGERRGYSIAALEQRGVGYAVATDLDGNESAELVASLH
jgi:anti-sigma factor RsiW